MKNNLVKNLGWRWEMVTNLDEWRIPDGEVMNLSFRLNSNKKDRIYDLGCGLGRHVIYFAKQGFQVSGCDISEKAVSYTKNWLKEEHLEADIKQGTYTSIQQPNNSFNLVIAINVIYHGMKHEIIKGFSEVFRILKPGGLFFGTLKTKEKNEPFYNERLEIINNQTIILKDGIEAGVPHFFTYKEDLIEFCKDFKIENIVYSESYDTPTSINSFLQNHGSAYFRFMIRKP